MHSRLLILLLALAILLPVLVYFSPPAYAGGSNCTASPGSAPVGTTFTLHAYGFSPNTPLYSYAVDPGGTAFSDSNFNAFGGAMKSDGNGNVGFSFSTRFDVQDFAIARAFGGWQLVVQQLGPGGTVVHQAVCALTVTPNGDAAPAGASMVAMPSTAPVGSEVVIYASGFAPGEIVNLWVSPPLGCSSFGYGFPRILLQYSTASAFAQDNVRADGGGEFAYKLPTDRTYSCPGDWALSANQPASKKGAIAYFKLTPQGVFQPGQPGLAVDASSGSQRGGTFHFNGWYYLPNSVVSCWLGRPDMTLRFIDNFPTNTAGAFGFSFTTGFDDEAHQVHYSEGPGTYTMSCRDNKYGTEASVSFSLSGGGSISGTSTTGSTTTNPPAMPFTGPMSEP